MIPSDSLVFCQILFDDDGDVDDSDDDGDDDDSDDRFVRTNVFILVHIR